MVTAILQSNYIPWKGYFDIIGSVELFIFHDDLQYTKNDWRNRNKIKTPRGAEWLSVPCGTNENRLICEVELRDHSWQAQHWSKITSSYSRSKYFKKYKTFFEDFYLGRNWANLSEMNQIMISSISQELLGIETRFTDSRCYGATAKKSARVLELLDRSGATSYLSGPAAKSYLNQVDFDAKGLDLHWMEYTGYPEYTQLYPPFIHEVSILDMLFNLGDETASYMLFNKKGSLHESLPCS